MSRMLGALCGLLLVWATAETCSDDVTELLQAHILTETESDKQSSLRDSAKLLAQAKKECQIKQTHLCLSLLQDLRKTMWPYVMGELAETNANLRSTPTKIREDGPRPDIFRALLKRSLCDGTQPRTMYFVDLSESKNQGIIRNLNGVSKGPLKLQPGNSKEANCKELADKKEPNLGRSTLVMVRDPLQRFISGYASLEESLKEQPIQEYKFLDAARGNLTERVTLFLDRFFRDGANYNSHVAPMSEYVANILKSCPVLPKKFFAHAEDAEQQLTRFLKKKGCKDALQHFNALDSYKTSRMGGKFANAMGQEVLKHDTFDGKFSMKSLAANLDANAETGGASHARGQKARAHANNQNNGGASHARGQKARAHANNQNNQHEAPARPHDQRSHVQNADVQTARASQGSDQGADAEPFGPQDVQEPQLLETSAEASTSATAMMTVLGLYDYVYLRAFCWMNLPDYVIFDYNLPAKCHREDLDVILKMTQALIDEDHEMTSKTQPEQRTDKKPAAHRNHARPTDSENSGSQ